MLRYLALLSFACCCLGIAADTRADCIDACMAGKDCSLNYSGACSSALGDCSIECMRSQGPAFGAIAYDRISGAFGYSYQLDNPDAAGASAMRFCAKNGDDCRMMITFSDACAALAAGKNGAASVVASVVADNTEVAQSKAVADCTANGGEGCEIKAWSCSFP